MYLGNTFLFNGYLISTFSLIVVVVVVILYYIASKRIRIPSANSLLKGLTKLSVFSYKASPLKRYTNRRLDSNDFLLKKRTNIAVH